MPAPFNPPHHRRTAARPEQAVSLFEPAGYTISTDHTVTRTFQDVAIPSSPAISPFRTTYPDGPLERVPESPVSGSPTTSLLSPQSALDQACAKYSKFSRNISILETLYLDLGLEYHALPTELRHQETVDQMQQDCQNAFSTDTRADPIEPEMMGFISDLRQSRDVAKQMLQRGAVQMMDAELREAEDALDHVGAELDHLAKQVRKYREWYEEIVSTGFEFRAGNGPRLVISREDRRPDILEAYDLLRGWILALPEVKGWQERGIVQCDEEAFLVAASAEMEDRINEDEMDGDRNEEGLEEEGTVADEGGYDFDRLEAPTPFNSRRNSLAREILHMVVRHAYERVEFPAPEGLRR